MKFKHLEVEQSFKFKNDPTLYVKAHGRKAYRRATDPAAVSSMFYIQSVDSDIEPESEPPSVITTAKRDARWRLIVNMEIKAADVKLLRERDGMGMFEVRKRIRADNLRGALDVLNYSIETEKLEDVLHDLIEIVRELV